MELNCPVYAGLLKAYVASTESYFDAVNALSAKAGEPDFSEALRASLYAGADCEAARSALEQHKNEHGCQSELSAILPESLTRRHWRK